MEEEKDNRVFGAMDGASGATCSGRYRSAGWSGRSCSCPSSRSRRSRAARAIAEAIDAVPNPEIHNGLAVQMIDEVRHSTIQMNLKRLYMNHSSTRPAST